MRSSLSHHSLVSTAGSCFSSSQLALDSLIVDCEEQALSSSTLFPMTASSAAYKFTKFFSATCFSSVLHSPYLLRLVTGFTALSAEVLCFETSSRLCTTFNQQGPNGLFEWEGEQGFKRGLLHGFLSFGSLKLVPHSINSIFVQHFLQDSALVASHHLESLCFGSARPEGSLGWQFLHAEITLMQMQTGMFFFNLLSGHSLQRAERNLEFKEGLSSQRIGSLARAREPIPFHRIEDNPLDQNNPTRSLLRRFQSGDRKAEQELLREGMGLLYSFVK